MLHRHLTHQQYTLAAIIARGKRQDWAELRKAALADRAVLEKILRVCQAHVALTPSVITFGKPMPNDTLPEGGRNGQAVQDNR
jgi:D-Tyr-tRNAtyr deacylase